MARTEKTAAAEAPEFDTLELDFDDGLFDDNDMGFDDLDVDSLIGPIPTTNTLLMDL